MQIIITKIKTILIVAIIFIFLVLSAILICFKQNSFENENISQSRNTKFINECANTVPSGLIVTNSISNEKYLVIEGYPSVKDTFQTYLLKDSKIYVFDTKCKLLVSLNSDKIIEKYSVVNGINFIELNSDTLTIHYHINPDASIIQLVNIEAVSDSSFHILCAKDAFNGVKLNCSSIDEPLVIKEIETILVELNSWDKSELILINEPNGNKEPSGESNGWVSSHIAELKKYGIEAYWDKNQKMYQIRF
ncbi:hypothetical protein JW796_00565 [Candidatus Dojkabacteria bacterium]|nr:hypothetical protein [Candidatus Dojkabacteria bacterium]